MPVCICPELLRQSAAFSCSHIHRLQRSLPRRYPAILHSVSVCIVFYGAAFSVADPPPTAFDTHKKPVDKDYARTLLPLSARYEVLIAWHHRL